MGKALLSLHTIFCKLFGRCLAIICEIVNGIKIVMGEAGRLLGERTLRSSNSTEQKSPNGGLNRNWDDEFVLKRQFAALIPAFDPRPGRTNVNQVFLFCHSAGLIACSSD